MKKLLPLLPPLVLAITMISACEKAPAPAPDTTNSEQEIERRVQERVAQERQADQARELEAKNADLQRKERELADREAALQKERDARAQADASSPPADPESDDDAPPVVSNGAFYDSLAPYGQWLQIPGQSGYVWQPNVGRQNPNWRPYQQGRWAYTDQGWTWVSDEPFGWATYHYGRWTRLREAGWVWVPGDEWAPAWVSWRSSDDYVGWSPLPPDAGFGSSTVITYDSGFSGGGVDFCFVPYVRFCEPQIATYIVAPQYNTTIINKTVNITKIVRNRNRNTVVINNAGPQPAIVQQKTGRPVRPLQIRPNRGGGKSEVSGNTLTVGVPSQPTAGPRQPQNVRPLPASPNPRSTGVNVQPANSAGNPNPPAETEIQRLQRTAREREQQLRAGGGQIGQGTVPQPPLGREVIRNGDQIQPMERGQRQRTEAERLQAQAQRQQAASQQQQLPQNAQQPAAPFQNPAQPQIQRQQQAAQQLQQQQAAQQQREAIQQQQAARAQRQAERAQQAQPAPQPAAPQAQPHAAAPQTQVQPAADAPADDGRRQGKGGRDKDR